MGSLLCCFRAVAREEPEQPESPVHGRCCSCFSYCVQPFRNGYTALFRRGESHVVPLPVETTTPPTFTSNDADCSAIDTFHPPPRPLAFDDPRFSLQRDDAPLLWHDKSSSPSHEETEPLRGGCDKPCSETGTKDKTDGSKCGAKLHSSDLPSRRSSKKTISGLAYYFCPTEDEDVCPTCLEEYTTENPKIILQCSHDFHLSCIYEWMERSEACPVCGKMMMFVEK